MIRWAIVASLAFTAPVAAREATPVVDIAETKDRLNPDGMRKLVSEPLAGVAAGDLAAGKAKFEAQIGRLSNSPKDALLRADMLMAFGVMLYTDGAPGGATDPVMQAALEYLRRGVEAYRVARGPDHPDRAMALHSFAELSWIVDGDNPSPAVEQAFAEAYRIRLAALGRANAETAMTLTGLANLAGAPKQTGKEPGKIAASAAMFREALTMERSASERKIGDAEGIRRALLLMYLANDRPAEARGVLEDMRTELPLRGPVEPLLCDTFWGAIAYLSNYAGAHGDEVSANALADEYRAFSVEDCKAGRRKN